MLEKGRSPLVRGECNLAVRAAAAKLLGVPHCPPVDMAPIMGLAKKAWVEGY